MKTLKNFWNVFGDTFGKSIVHPQYIKKRLEYVSIQEAKKYAKGKLVDVGCGRMPYRRELEPFVEQYIGVDHPSLSKMYDSNKKPEVLADVTNLPLPDNSFDIALNLQVLEYLEDPLKAISEIHRILKPKGILILSAPFLYSTHDNPYDLSRYTENGIKILLKKSGFKIIAIKSLGGFLEFWFLSLDVFLLKRIKDILSKKKSLFSIVYLLFLVVITPFFVLPSNILVFLLQPLKSLFDKFENNFPLEIMVVARKQ